MTSIVPKQESDTSEITAETLEMILVQGDLSKLSAADRLMYYMKTCESLGLNYLTRPFDYITLNGRLTLYAKKECTDQLSELRGISRTITDVQMIDDIYVVRAVASKGGRTEESTGAVPLAGLKGEAKANATMKAETKAKRRATLSFCGLGWIDESETDSITNVQTGGVDILTGELVKAPVEPVITLPKPAGPPPGPPPAPKPEESRGEIPDQGDLSGCPLHGEVEWTLNMSKFSVVQAWHPLEEGGGCYFAPAHKDLFATTYQQVIGNDGANDWLKGNFEGRTWSKLTPKDILAAIELLTS